MSDAARAHRRRERRILLGLAGAVVLFMLLDGTVHHVCDDAWHVLPLLGFVVPLLFGRYVGEELIERLRARRRPRPRRRAAACAPRAATRRQPERALRPVLAGLTRARRPPPLRA